MNTDKIIEDCLIKMFEAVGLEYSFDEVLEYAKQDNWYMTKTWTKDREDEFTAWMDELLKKRTSWNKETRAKEIGYFLLQWGWKRADPCPECGQDGFHKMSCDENLKQTP